MSSFVVPGQPLPAHLLINPQPQIGSGCYARNGSIIASVVGEAVRDGAIVSVRGKAEGRSSVPEIGATVIGTVSRLTNTEATILISLVNSLPVPASFEDFKGAIRLSDVRLTERDKLKMGECFRLGDVVRAKVISLGDARSYMLSTAENELGVISGTSISGNPLAPASWQDMVDSVTGQTEKRKVAKP